MFAIPKLMLALGLALAATGGNAQQGKVDLVLIPIGGHFTMGPADAAYALRELIKPKYAIPMHYGTNPFIKGTPQELIQALGSTSTRVVPLKPGEQADF